MKILVVKTESDTYIGNASQVANFIGVSKMTVSRWVNSGDRKVFKNGFEILLKVKQLK